MYYSRFKTPIFLAVFPITDSTVKTANQIFEDLRSVSRKYKGEIYFAYANSSSEIIKSMDLDFNNIPGAKLLFSGPRNIPYPSGWPLNFDYISKFCDMYLNSDIPSENSEIHMKPKSNLNSPIYIDVLKITKILKPNNFITETEKPHCSLLFFFNSLVNTDLYFFFLLI